VRGVFPFHSHSIPCRHGLVCAWRFRVSLQRLAAPRRDDGRVNSPPHTPPMAHDVDVKGAGTSLDGLDVNRHASPNVLSSEQARWDIPLTVSHA
jgi:hypothetical protein